MYWYVMGRDGIGWLRNSPWKFPNFREFVSDPCFTFPWESATITAGLPAGVAASEETNEIPPPPAGGDAGVAATRSIPKEIIVDLDGGGAAGGVTAATSAPIVVQGTKTSELAVANETSEASGVSEASGISDDGSDATGSSERHVRSFILACLVPEVTERPRSHQLARHGYVARPRDS